MTILQIKYVDFVARVHRMAGKNKSIKLFLIIKLKDPLPGS